MEDRALWANTWHQHLTGLAAGNELVVAVLDLHKPDDRGDCAGCDSEGYEAEQPEYGCSTVALIAQHFTLSLEAKCSVCGSRQRALIAGGPVGHHRRDGNTWVSCPGSSAVVEALPWRSEAEVMADLTDRLTVGVSAALLSVDPVPPAVQLFAVKKWGQQAQAGAALFRE